jgi:hypothetical protein
MCGMLGGSDSAVVQRLEIYGQHLTSRALKLNRFSRQFKLGSQRFVDRIIVYDFNASSLPRARTFDGETAE